MRYIIVNERKPKGLPRFCSYDCSHVIHNTYLRELQDRILYCSAMCYDTHNFETRLTAGKIDTPLYLPYEKGGLR